MVRVKFLLFALMVLALVPAHVALLTPIAADHVLHLAQDTLRSLPYAAGWRIAERRALTHHLAQVSAQAPRVRAALRQNARQGSATAAKLVAVQEAVKASLPEQLHADVIIGLIDEEVALYAHGDGAPTDGTDALDLRPLAEPAIEGTAAPAFELEYWFAAAPVIVPDRNELRTAATLMVGLPHAPANWAASLDEELKGLGVLGVGLSSQGKLLSSVTQADHPRFEDLTAAASLERDAVLPVARGAAVTLGSLKLPLGTAGDWTGGNTPLAIATRLPIPDTEMEVVVVKDLQPAMQHLAEYQRGSLVALGGLLFLTLVWLLLMGSGRAKEKPEEKALSVPPSMVRQRTAAPSSPALRTPPPMPLPEPAPGEANPEDLLSNPEDLLFGGAAPATVVTSRPPTSADPDDDEATHALPPNRPLPFEAFPSPEAHAVATQVAATPLDDASPADLLGQLPPAPHPGSAPYGQGPAEGEAYNPEATRVASVPHELLHAAAQGTDPMGAELRSGGPLPGLNPLPAMGEDPEEMHFQSVFRDFLQTREQCGEPAEGLSFDKFAQKLRKNRDQMLQKYGCRTVRFQVYVKEGKAALKATPIRD